MTQPILATLPTPAQELELAKPKDRIELLRDTLSANGHYIRAALDRFMSTDRFQRIVLTLVRDNKDLIACKPSTIILAALRIAQLRLSPDPALGQAWLIPRKARGSSEKLAQFQLGWKGALALAYRSKRVLAVRYSAVSVKDEFVWKDGKNWQLDHVPDGEGWPENQGATRAAWAILDLRGGGQIPRVMFLPEILRHKSRGEGSQPAWVSDFAAMAVKTVISDLCRRGPVEEEMGSALAWDAGEQVEDPEIKNVTPTAAADSSTREGAFVAAFGEAEPATPPAEESAQQAGAGEAGKANSDDDDFLGDALDGVGESRGDDPEDDLPTPRRMPDHVRRVLAQASAIGKTADEVSAMLGAPVHEMPAGEEERAMRMLRDSKPRR